MAVTTAVGAGARRDRRRRRVRGENNAGRHAPHVTGRRPIAGRRHIAYHVCCGRQRRRARRRPRREDRSDFPRRQ